MENTLKSKKYWRALFVLFLLNALAIFIYNDVFKISICPQIGCIENFKNYYSPIIKAIEIQLILFGIWTVIDRIVLTEKQIESLSQVNSFNGYIQHRKEFFDLTSRCEEGQYKILGGELLYQKLFSSNTPRHFTTIPTIPDESPISILGLVNEFNEIIDSLNKIGKKTQGFSHFASKEICEVLSDYNILRGQLGVKESDDVQVIGKNSSFMGAFSHLPLCPSESIHRTANFLNGLVKFCCYDLKEYQLKDFNYSLSTGESAYYHLVVDESFSNPADLGFYEEGEQAFINRVSISDCPYHQTSIEFKVWHEGWKAASSQINET